MNTEGFNFPWLFQMAWRDSRKNRSRLFLFISSIILGIAALVAIYSIAISLASIIYMFKSWFLLAWYPYLMDWTAAKGQQIIIPKLQATGNILCTILFPVLCLVCVWCDFVKDCRPCYVAPG